jgi:Mg2+ and Co2+ transporter CorA
MMGYRKPKIDVSLEKYIDSRIEALEKLMSNSLNDVEKNTTSKAAELEKWLSGMNEFREALKDQQGLFILRSEAEAYHREIKKDIKILMDDRSELKGKTEQMITEANNKVSKKSFNILIWITIITSLLAIISTVVTFIKT